MRREDGRRRNQTVTIEGGVLRREVCSSQGSGTGKAGCIWPRRDEIITPWMADPNRSRIGYSSQEVVVCNARTSGVFWTSARIRDNRTFPKNAEKTLQRQGLESVSAEGMSPEEAEDHLLWPGVRPPEGNPE